MPVSPARREAFAILFEVERGNAHSDDLLRQPRVSVLSAQDRHLTTALVLGTLRWQLSLDALIRPLLARPNARLDAEVLTALRMAAFQLLYLDRIPAHAAISESVELVKFAGHRYASGMVNAVLRKVAAMSRLPEPTVFANDRELAEATAHPLWLVERWAAQHGFAAAAEICRHGQRQPGLTLHLDNLHLEEDLAGEAIQLAPGALLSHARRVVSGDATVSTLIRADRARIQEEGSQLIAELAGTGERILDCCAAPGGKTLLLAERNPHAEITAVEYNTARAAALRQRLSASPWADHLRVEQADATALAAESFYDLVLADVPCSGTGTLGRNPEIRHRLQYADLARHHARQCAILAAALRAGRRRVVYSTCSLEPEENAEVVREVLANSPNWRQIAAAVPLAELTEHGRLTNDAQARLVGSLASDGSLTLLPGYISPDHPTDGFFMAILEKRP